MMHQSIIIVNKIWYLYHMIENIDVYNLFYEIAIRYLNLKLYIIINCNWLLYTSKNIRKAIDKSIICVRKVIVLLITSWSLVLQYSVVNFFVKQLNRFILIKNKHFDSYWVMNHIYCMRIIIQINSLTKTDELG